MGISKRTMEVLLKKHEGNNADAAREAGMSESQWYQYKRLYKFKTPKNILSPHQEIIR